MKSLPAREGAFWLLVALGAPRLLGTIVTVALRRFLGPGISGTFDLAYTPYQFLDGFRNFGTGPALIYEQRVDQHLADTAWTLNMVAAVAVTIIAQILAAPIARYFGHPQIEPVFRALSIAYVFSSIASVHYFLLLRDLNFRLRAIPPIGQVVAAGIISVLFALWGFGVGALVAREIASAVAGAVLLWALYPFRPSIQLMPRMSRRLLSYGAWIGAGLTLMYMSQNVDVFIGGHVIHSTSQIGFYTTSWTVAFITAGIFSLFGGNMVFPILSRLRDSSEALQERLLKALRQIALLLIPVAIFIACAAPVLITPVLGTKFAPYRASFPVLSILATYAGTRTLLAVFFEGYKAVGIPWLVPIYNLVKLAVTAPAMWYAAHFGITGLAAVYVPVQIVEIPAGLALAWRVLGLSPARVVRAVHSPLLASLLMAGGVLATELALTRRIHASDLATLGVCLAVAALLYGGALLLLDRPVLTEARAVLLHGL